MASPFCLKAVILESSDSTDSSNVVKRAPAVEPIFEIKDSNIGQGNIPHKGYDFTRDPKSQLNQTKRAPANIVSKPNANERLSFLGPLIFFLTLPFCLWLIIDRKFIFKKNQNETLSITSFPHEPQSSSKEQNSKDDDPNDKNNDPNGKGNFNFPKAS